MGIHFAAFGVYTGNALLLRYDKHSYFFYLLQTYVADSWPSENISGQIKRAVGVHADYH